MKKKIAKKNVKKTQSNKKPQGTLLSNYEVNKKLDKILITEKRLLKEERLIEKEEEKIEEKDKVTAKEEQKEEKELEILEKKIANGEKETEKGISEIEKLEMEIRKEVGEHPLTKISLKDVVKGFVGAFIGLAVHYTFTYGVEISEHLDFKRATFLFVLSFFVGLLFIYATGFRKVKDTKILMFMPVRLIVLYAAAILMSIFVLYIFYPNFGHEFLESYKMVAGVLLAAIVGACTADLIGKE